MIKHPNNKAERLRLLEAKASQQRKINGQKRKIYVAIQEEESENDLRNYLHQQGVAGSDTGSILGVDQKD